MKRDQVIELCDLWGEWVKADRPQGGYPKQAPYVSLMPRHGMFKSCEPDVQEDMLRMDSAVACLPEICRRAVIQKHVKVSGSERQMAKACGVSRERFPMVLAESYRLIDESLNKCCNEA